MPTIVPLIGATCTLEELFLLPTPSVVENQHEVRPSPGMVSKNENKKLPRATHYKKKYIAKNIDSPLPGESGSKASDGRNDITAMFYTLLLKQALRIRNEFFHKLHVDLSDEVLHERLWAYVEEACKILEIEWSVTTTYELAMDGESTSKMWLNDENVDRKIRNAMYASAEMWDESKLATLHAASRRGGMASNVYENVAAYLETRHIRSHAAAGRVLGWDYRTVKKMREHFDAMTDDELLQTVEQEDRNGHELQEATTGNAEADALRDGVGEETRNCSLGLAEHEHAGSNGPVGNAGSSSRFDENYHSSGSVSYAFAGSVPY